MVTNNLDVLRYLGLLVTIVVLLLVKWFNFRGVR
jgi:hypothetical protein